MKRILAAMVLVPAIVGAQNLVTNATMIQTNSAAFHPTIEKAEGWSNSNGGTADLFVNRDHACSDGIPGNYMGTQDGADGNYAGIIAYYGDERLSLGKTIENGELTDEIGYGKYTEYLQGELSEPLKAGQVYTLSFQVSLAEESDRAIKGLGAYVSAEKLNERSNSFLQVTPQVISTEFITDKAGWTKISGTFIAHGGERYFTIGAFPSYLSVQDVSSSDENDSRKAYYYIARPNIAAWSEKDKVKPPVTHTISSATEGIGEIGSVTFLGIHFETGSAAFKPGDYEKLDAVVRYLNENPDVKIEVDGHTDAVGSAAYNQALSERRAVAVENYLTGKGISSARIKTSAYGERFPIEHTAYESAKNRRIEMYRVE